MPLVFVSNNTHLLIVFAVQNMSCISYARDQIQINLEREELAVSKGLLMKLENFTEQSKLCIKGAENLARSKKNQMLCPEHLLKQILSA